MSKPPRKPRHKANRPRYPRSPDDERYWLRPGNGPARGLAPVPLAVRSDPRQLALDLGISTEPNPEKEPAA
jgi:hypothetical protein